MLFKSHSDLLEEFTYFLPDSTPPSQQVTCQPARLALATCCFISPFYIVTVSCDVLLMRIGSCLQPKRPMGRGKPFGRSVTSAAASNFAPKRKSRRGEDADYAGAPAHADFLVVGA